MFWSRDRSRFLLLLRFYRFLPKSAYVNQNGKPTPLPFCCLSSHEGSLTSDTSFEPAGPPNRADMDNNCEAFQSKLASIMEMLAKAAVVEISKLWEDGFALIQVELRRRESEIKALNNKLMSMENERLLAHSQASNKSSTFSNREQLLPPSGDGRNYH